MDKLENFFKAINDHSRQMRANRFSNSNQLSLGELIEKLDATIDEKEDKCVSFDFGTAVPTTLDSWRGSYDELALGYKLTGYDNNEDHFGSITNKALIEELKSAIGKEFTGWKGREFVMDESTPVWVDNAGNSSNTAIVGVLDDGWRVVLITSFTEY